MCVCVFVCECVGHCVWTLLCDASMCSPDAVALGWNRVSSLNVICTLSGPMLQHWFLFVMRYSACAVSCVCGHTWTLQTSRVCSSSGSRQLGERWEGERGEGDRGERRDGGEDEGRVRGEREREGERVGMWGGRGGGEGREERGSGGGGRGGGWDRDREGERGRRGREGRERRGARTHTHAHQHAHTPSPNGASGFQSFVEMAPIPKSKCCGRYMTR